MDSRFQNFETGHEAFRKIAFNKNKERFRKLVEEGQQPKALFIGCSDSRVMPAMITNSKPGDLFIVRNIGNFVAPFNPDADFHATASAIEYAVSILEVSDIIVCGHSHCGAIAALYKEIEPTQENIHTIKWLELGQEAKKVALLAHRESTTEVLHCYTEQMSVIYQLDNLLTYPAVRKRVEDGTLFLHGWHYNLEDGTIESYDDENFEFKPLSQK
ncbi:carbonic anhydrase [Sulfurovum sp.]|uniref:carbonic anhydrase n=1 Tax=Sulfurovum sp. TaxID=1969726 RepID=UPI0025D18E6E|nr:carbonic anhydrase [Sulfurovum sp.]